METTKQQGLNEVVVRKVERMINDNRKNVHSTVNRLTREGQGANDFIVPIGVDESKGIYSKISFGGEAGLHLSMSYGKYAVHNHAVGQIAARLNIPSKYLRELSQGTQWEQNLASTILNQHVNHTLPARVLVRTVDSQVRGVLSDSYKRLNSQLILMAFFEEIQMQQAVVCNAHMSDTKIWAETILPTPLIIPTAKNGDIIVFMGARFSTSDYGDGAVDMRSFLLNGACLNGMVHESVMKQVHLGAKLPEDILLSDKTYELETQTTVSAVRDLTKILYDRKSLADKMQQIQSACETEIDFKQTLSRLIQNNRLLKAEGEQVEKLLMQNNPLDGLQGEATRWKFTQALTAFARDIEPVRAREIQELSGELLKKLK